MLERKHHLNHPELKIGIIKLPSISNFSDFDPLENEESIEIEWVIKSQNLNKFDFVILPGSKQTIKDQLFLEKSGLSDDIREYSAVSYTHLRAHETKANLVCRLLLEKKNLSV